MPPSAAEILEFLRAHFAPSADRLVALKAGWFSQAWAFSTDEGEYVVRLNEWEVDFQKDALAGLRFSGPDLPVPPVVRLERFDERYFYAITPRCPGKDLNGWDADTRQRQIPYLFAALAALRGQDASGYPGWGLTDGQFQGLFDSWPAYLRAIYNQKFSYDLADLEEGTFFEPDLYQATVRAMQDLFPYLPEQKWLVHGDFGGHNVVSDGERITGVLDWAEARLGDYLYDVATLEYWGDVIPYAQLWREYATRRGFEEPYFAERIRCYLLYHCAGDLRLSAYRKDYREYVWAKKKLAGLI